MKRQLLLLEAITALVLLPHLSARGGNTDEGLNQSAGRAINNLQSSDSGINNFFKSSAGYVVFPKVREHGLDHNDILVAGVVYQNGEAVGKALLGEANVQQKDGSSAFHEVIFFESNEALENFRQGKLVLTAAANVVTAKEGAAVNSRYRNGVIVFVVPQSGLMEPINIGVQYFAFEAVQ